MEQLSFDSSRSFMNIITNSCVPSGSYKKCVQEERVTVRMNTKDIFAIHPFAKHQFIRGMAQGLIKTTDEDRRPWMKLVAIICADPCNVTEELLDRSDVKLLKYWLECQMEHCEKERDEGKPAFNPDTYIGQKFLLLDLREWLLGEIIE